MKKFIVLIYGLIAYLVFLISFLYAIAFVGDFLVPKTINSETESTGLSAIIINLSLLSIFAIQHSVMARPAFKAWWIKIIGKAAERSTYILLTSLALLLIFWKWQPINTVVWEVGNSTLAMLIFGISALGWLIVLLSTFMISHFELFGLTQIFDNFKSRTSKSATFQTNFLYKIVRHPIMLGFIIAFWFTPVMTLGHLLFASVTSLYILIAVKYLEEKDLRKTLGKAYEDYQQKVPMILPFSKIAK
ncbi:isoprenylcysteine carboxylmethyltransferase family protein [Subsaximicrobium wynnwilliamsii]|uniref:methanethiol S-methyltransferase n=1 Tax=Subsaximicrobium wynnwilliamsii TaxID=291179 RepID=A0A5C6ZJY1_9FLAO|nr:methanethiol S-methyltransferase [Subsaximicrobium wynnwilliamsii]TXD84083.1 isoprenylcysteine carboxylmethyltransferase family protein [Subsaximicrobium wynnwilliamsii]TXD88959.1 isoprenylcysteine carboxylmethyltransferase family protein [Subsaximicrobium wynnwilliamsii]TXE03795.1 isoprenylcysteine carboxylmethyltransferase family protein [Subsaximicrobium wynnwilliamsii]